MNYTNIKLEVDDSVATLTLDRPSRKNAMDLAMRGEIGHAVEALRANDSVRSLILTGSGGAFCAGGDIAGMASGDISAEDGRKRMQRVHPWLKNLIELDRPVIAAVDGVAYGAGFNLALAADLILATPQARFCLSFMRIGLVPDFAGLYTLPRVVGVQRAKELVFSAREIDAATARDWGIVMEVVEGQALAPRARQIARALALASPAALGLAKAGLNRSFDSGLDAMLEFEATAQGIAFSTDYHRNAVRRFMQKQAPLFQWPAAGEAK